MKLQYSLLLCLLVLITYCYCSEDINATINNTFDNIDNKICRLTYMIEEDERILGVMKENSYQMDNYIFYYNMTFASFIIMLLLCIVSF